jgi:uncharacterized membrane protein
MQETPSSTSAPGRSRKGLRIALVLSLALNLLLIGVMAGGVMRYAHRPPPAEMQTDYRSLWRALPAEARADLRAAVRDYGVAGERPARLSPEERRARVHRTHADIIALLRAEPFDADAFQNVLDSERNALMGRLQAARQAFAARVAGLTAGERAAMAADLEQVWADRLPER